MSEPLSPDRLQKLAELDQHGEGAYPARPPFGRDQRALASELAERIAADGEGHGVLYGRVLGRRGYGKLAFLDVVDRSGRLQACLQKDLLPAADFALLKLLNRGDHVALEGRLGRTKTGEPTLFAERFAILSKTLLDPPEKWHGLADVELRARLRYVDLYSNPEVRERFLRRSAAIAAMREVFRTHDYAEVETPVLQPIYGGAHARPFLTHHNALDMRLYLRIAPELYLKRLLVGGLERVYEFARVFRNEGLSPRHNPEFTMLEFYEAYGDYRTMMDRCEELVVAAARAAASTERADGLRVRFRDEDFDLTPPFQRISWEEAFTRHAGCSPRDRAAVDRLLDAHDLHPEDGSEDAWWRAANQLFEELVEPHLRGPVFVHDYPSAVCPLAKPRAEDPAWAERFEFFLGGMELANAFSELNDPRLQRKRFEQQVAEKDPEAPNQVDEDYLRALAHGMPPAGGCGIGVDRLVMVLLGCDSIREVLLFPHLRPEDGSAAAADLPSAEPSA